MSADLIIDCESLSLEPNAAVWQIGAVCGDQTFECTINPYFLICNTDFHVDQATLDWQLVNNLENYKDAQTISPDFGPSWLLENLIAWINELPSKPTAIWSRHPIDITWLTNMAKVTGIQLPWKYWQCYDIATVAHLAGERLGKPPANAHNALTDARFDSIELRRLKEKLRNGC